MTDWPMCSGGKASSGRPWNTASSKLPCNRQNTAMAIKVVRELISDPRPEARFGADALEIARRLCEATEYKDILALDVLAAAYAETGDFAQAEATVRKAMETPLGQTPNNASRVAEAADPLPSASEACHPAARRSGMGQDRAADMPGTAIAGPLIGRIGRIRVARAGRPVTASWCPVHADLVPRYSRSAAACDDRYWSR